MARHTQGPWTLWENPDSDIMRPELIVYGPNNGPLPLKHRTRRRSGHGDSFKQKVAFIYTPMHPAGPLGGFKFTERSVAEGRCNARLIACAPDIYDSLQEMFVMCAAGKIEIDTVVRAKANLDKATCGWEVGVI